MTANGRIDIYAKTASYLLNSGGGMQYSYLLSQELSDRVSFVKIEELKHTRSVKTWLVH